MKTLSARFRARYGASPLHLLAVVLCFALAAYTVLTLGVSALWDPKVWWQSIVVWFVGAVLLHDLVLFPLYTLAERGLHSALRGSDRQRGSRLPVSPLNYIRVPAAAVGLLLLLFFPGIVEQGAASYLRATGQTQGPFLVRWLLLAVAIFGVSALAYLVALIRARHSATRLAEVRGTSPDAQE